jgi:hypothetical protein
MTELRLSFVTLGGRWPLRVIVRSIAVLSGNGAA